MSTDLIERVPCDRQGALRLECLPDLDPRTIVVAQAGNVNSGSFDPIAAICARAQNSGA